MIKNGSFARGEQNEKSDLDFRINKGNIRGMQIGGLQENLANNEIEVVLSPETEKYAK